MALEGRNGFYEAAVDQVGSPMIFAENPIDSGKKASFLRCQGVGIVLLSQMFVDV